MFVDIDEMRDFVNNAYIGEEWEKRVSNMSDRQIMAIYFSMQERDIEPKENHSRKADPNIMSSLHRSTKDGKIEPSEEYIQLSLFN